MRTRTPSRSEEHTSELQSRPHLVCRLLLEKKKEPLLEQLHHPADRRRRDVQLVGGARETFRPRGRLERAHAVEEGHFFFLDIRQPRRSTLFPYTTLFR